MLIANQLSAKRNLVRRHWLAVSAGTLAVWTAFYAVTASAEQAQAGADASVLWTEPSGDFRMPAKSWLSHIDVSKPAYGPMVNSDASFGAPGSYFHALTRLYGASIEPHADPAKQAAVEDELVLQDEVAKFHQLETHVPIALARITSEFGQRPNPLGKGHAFHRGIDLAAPAGTSVYAVAAGKVIRASRDRTYGNVVVIDHNNGYKTLYAHNSKLLVKVGEQVKPGQPIAKVGSTGHSTGPHLHFEIHRSGERVDPGPYLAAF